MTFGPKCFERVVVAWPQHSFSKCYPLTDVMLRQLEQFVIPQIYLVFLLSELLPMLFLYWTIPPP